MKTQQCRAWLDGTDGQAGLDLYWWQRLITFGVGRTWKKVINHYMFNIVTFYNINAFSQHFSAFPDNCEIKCEVYLGPKTRTNQYEFYCSMFTNIYK